MMGHFQLVIESSELTKEQAKTVVREVKKLAADKPALKIQVAGAGYAEDIKAEVDEE